MVLVTCIDQQDFQIKKTKTVPDIKRQSNGLIKLISNLYVFKHFEEEVFPKS